MRIKAMMLLLFCFGLSQFGYAQSPTGAKDQPQSDLAALRTDIRALQAEQQRINNLLNELKQLLQANGQPPPAVTTVSVRGEAYRGDSTARVAIIEYADFECPYCGQYERSTFPQLLSDYIQTGKVKYFYRDLPLPMHARAMAAARAARCAGEQGKYWEMHDSLFAKQTALSDPAMLDRAKNLGLDANKFSECFSGNKYSDDLRKSMAEAQRMGVDGTPTFLIGTVDPSGDIVDISKRIAGTHPYEVFESALDEVLASQSQEAVSTH